MGNSYFKYKNCSPAVQSIMGNKERSEELDNDVYRRQMINSDKENYEKVKALLLDDYIVKNRAYGGSECIYELEKDGVTETISIRYTNNINAINKILYISE
ncbi:hypothetical protein [Clostridium estertheticum]|uniref:Uncharacterized protein n=1 Tax=Clostridium estertheticum TaxID=238834 RepID=A0AA47ELV9_9CLOT|nr:hypothetical protein [Clostridium estertheticum]MBU3157844.1 hypothetical protein [Clostridium estertheticum]WAG62592.1 hypothetical protein LL038_10280 [Clostridium estertheticum]